MAQQSEGDDAGGAGMGDEGAPEGDPSQGSSARAPQSELPTWRALAFAVVLGLILAGPITRQALGARSRYLQGWQMFSGRALGDLDVDFHQVHEGRRERVPWGQWMLDAGRAESLLRHTHEVRHGRRPRSQVITKLSDVVWLGKKLCERLPDGAQLHARTRTATRAGWSRPRRIDQDLCDRRVRRQLVSEARREEAPGKGKGRGGTP